MDRRSFLKGVIGLVGTQLVSPLEIMAQEFLSKEEYIRKTDAAALAKDYRTAIRVGEAGISHYPKAWELYVTVATSYGRSKDWSMSQRYLEKMLSIVNGDKNLELIAYSDLSVVYYNLRKFKDLTDCLRKGLAINPTDRKLLLVKNNYETHFKDK